MGDLNLTIEKIAGAGDENFSCSVFNKKVTLSGGDSGTLVGCLTVEGSGDEERQTATRDIFELFLKKLETGEEGALELLESGQKATDAYLEGQSLEASFVFAFFFKDVCYIVRRGDLVKILVFDPPKSSEITFESGSGPARGGQLYLIATEKFLENFDKGGFLKKVDVDLRELVDGLATDISASGQQARLGAVFVYTKEEEKSPREAGERAGETSGGEEPQTVVYEEAETDRGLKLNLESLKAGVGGFLTELKGLTRGERLAIGRLRAKVAVFAIAIILTIAISLAFTLRQNYQKGRESEFAGHFAAASSKFSEGTALLELNRARAREAFIAAQSELELALEIKKSDAGAKKLAEDIKSKLKETEAGANINFETVADLSSGVNAISFSGKNMVVSTGDKLFSVDLANKSAEEAAESGGSSSIVFDNKVFVLTGSGILRMDLAGGEAKKIAASGEGQDIGVFFGNVYVLFGDRIAKIVPIEGGYAAETDYLAQKGDFLASSRFAIDGSIWVTRGDGVLKFTRGAQEDFAISGLSGSLGELGSIYTDADLANLYVLDKINAALLVVGKDGVYKKAFQAAEFGNASDLVVTEDESTLYIALDGKILSASIK
ncbi:hypothetical protein HYW40_01435 [Candidatus Curtissbacteria bacterium]|nr:hypothetical protein [Candidatus Curtissbacteria bacterium]